MAYWRRQRDEIPSMVADETRLAIFMVSAMTIVIVLCGIFIS